METEEQAMAVGQDNSPVLTLEQVGLAADVGGFTPEDFAVFDVAGFAARMPLLRERIKPKLARIGEAVAPRLPDVLGETVYPHVAQHLRRTVNAPEETWTAFSRSPRAYKPFVHLRASISAEKVRVTVFVEDYAEDKPVFADNLEKNADDLSLYLARHPTILAYELRDHQGEPLRGHALSGDVLRAFARRMKLVKGQHAVFGIAFARTHPVLKSGPEFVDAILKAAETMKPLYDCGRPGFIYAYAPVAIKGI